METRTWPLICPVCGAGLEQVGSALKCPASHSFDLSRDGYVNLMVGARRRPHTLGDTAEMLRARRRFLDQGHYDPLSDAINTRVRDHLLGLPERSGQAPLCVAEIGCGEGAYIGRLERHLDAEANLGNVRYFGMDVSKEAVRLAARRYQAIWFFVADVWKRVLLSTGSVHVLLDIFAPRNASEFDRILAQDSLLLVAIPTADHLASARAEFGLLGIETGKEQRVLDQFAGAFSLVGKHTVEYAIRLTGEEVRDLIQMTPSYWHTAPERRDQIARGPGASTQISVTILEFARG